jgi:hypothetical protein
MTDLTINSKLRMNSGYDIPILGYGVGMLSMFRFSWLILTRYIKCKKIS